MRWLRAFLGWDDPWRRPRPTRQQIEQDAWLGLGLVLLGVIALEALRAVAMGSAINDRVVEGYLWTLLMTVPLAVRRIMPITVMIVCSATYYVMGERLFPVAYSVVVQIALFMAIYTAWAWARHRRRLLVATGVMVLGMFGWLLQAMLTEVPDAGDSWMPASVGAAITSLGVNVAFFFGAIAWGQVSHRSARNRELLHEQTAQLRLQQEREASRALDDMRLGIARDLHDVVAHHVTAIGIQAAAARHVLDRDPAKSAGALAAIESSSREAVAEMHRMVGLLRSVSDDDGDDESWRLGLADLERWVSSNPGPPALHWRTVGEPWPVPESVQSSLYRVAQEAVANVRQHSTARRADVVLRYVRSGAQPAVELEVLDDGAPSGRQVPGKTSCGFGLQGIRERADAHGGEVEAGPRPEGGWRVRVRIPVPATPSSTGGTP